MTKQQYKQQHSIGKAWPFAFVAAALFLGVLYLRATNTVAVSGYAIREAEKEIATLRQDANQLRIEEADLKSLQRIEESGKRLEMREPDEVSYIEESDSIALR